MSLEDAMIGLKAYKEIDERMEQLWRNIDAAVVSPRMDTKAASLPRIKASDDMLELDGTAEKSIPALLEDLEATIAFLTAKLPSDMLDHLCQFMMVDFTPRLIREWLSPAVPSSLDDMEGFEAMIHHSKKFCESLTGLGYTGIGELQEWVDNAPTTWLGKCRETALDTIRSRLVGGIGKSKQVEKIERHMVSLAEGKELATTGAGATADTNDWGDDWGDAWDEDEDANEASGAPKSQATDAKLEPAKHQTEDDGADAWGWDEEEGETVDAKQDSNSKSKDDEDDAVEAWGWGDEDATEEVEPPTSVVDPSKKSHPKHTEEETRELVLKETYHISSMPEPVLELIFAILEDAVTLTKGDKTYGHVASAAPWLFDLPAMALTLFRAVSPHYYSLENGGNM